MSTVAERVERGAALLDEKRPGWWQEIDLGTLDIRSTCGCILGQIGSLLGDDGYLTRFSTGLDAVRLEVPQARDYGFEWDVDYGDATESEIDRLIDAECARLTEAWRDLIQRRRESAQVTE